MRYVTEHIAAGLQEARKAKGMSQRELSARSGVPQGHISRIESGAIDLRLSSLIALARILDLELILAPRAAMPAVQSIVRSNKRLSTPASEPTRLTTKDMARPAYSLDEDDDG